jgi:hypothetical protein
MISVIDSLVYRALKICDGQFLNEEINHIKTSLMNNHYPLTKINQRIEVMKERIKNNFSFDKTGHWVAIPFVGDVTYRIARILRKYLPVK